MPISETLSGVLIGGLFTLSGSVSVGLFHYFRTKKEVEAEDKRLRAELYMEQKVEALITFHAELEKCQRGVLQILDRVPLEDYGKENEREEAEELIEDFEVAMDRISVYLNEEQHQTVLNMFDKLREVNDSVDGWMYETKEMRRDELLYEHRSDLIEEYEEVKKVLQEEIRGPIEEFER